MPRVFAAKLTVLFVASAFALAPSPVAAHPFHEDHIGVDLVQLGAIALLVAGAGVALGVPLLRRLLGTDADERHNDAGR